MTGWLRILKIKWHLWRAMRNWKRYLKSAENKSLNKFLNENEFLLMNYGIPDLMGDIILENAFNNVEKEKAIAMAEDAFFFRHDSNAFEKISIGLKIIAGKNESAM